SLRRGERNRVDLANEYLGRDGGSIAVECSLLLDRDADGTPRQLFGLLRDVSAQRAAQAQLARIVQTIDEHLYTGEMLPDGRFRELFTGPNADRLMGGPVPEGVDPYDAWEASVHPDDHPAYAASLQDIAAGRT